MDLSTIESRLETLEKRVKKLEEVMVMPVDQKIVIQKKISAKEFLLSKDLKTDVQRVLVLGYYLEKMTGLQSFNVPDLEGTFRFAKEKLPTNMNDSVNKNISRGFIMEAAEKKDGKKAWVLTSTGERFVENEINK